MAPQTTIGAGVIVYVNNLPLGTVTHLSYSSQTPRRAQYKIDAIDPVELITGATKTSVEMTLIKTYGDGGVEGLGLTTYYDALLREKYFSVRVVDRVSQLVLYSASNCSVLGQRWDVVARGILQGQVQIEALDWNVGDIA